MIPRWQKVLLSPAARQALAVRSAIPIGHIGDPADMGKALDVNTVAEPGAPATIFIPPEWKTALQSGDPGLPNSTTARPAASNLNPNSTYTLEYDSGRWNRTR